MLNIGITSDEITQYLVSSLCILVYKTLPVAVTAKHLNQLVIYHLGGTFVLLSFY